jgi:hypothetical protein
VDPHFFRLSLRLPLLTGILEIANQFLCAVQRRRSSVGANPTRQLSFQPVAIGAVVEVTKLPKPLMERVGKRPREQAGRNVSER